MSDEETSDDARWQQLAVLREEFPDFLTFLRLGMEWMGFSLSDIQEDIGEYIANGPVYRMAQAQRGQAKTTIVGFYGIFRIIHDPSLRILIISSGEDMATEISAFIVRVIMNWDVLECLRPGSGSRKSVTAFDVHYALKGPDKSPSIACLGISSNLQGKRADLLIADDVESSKNSKTAKMRDDLLHQTLDFTSLCTDGDIIWLGTPQSSDSIYNTLPGRGVDIRIWPGRYPTPEELPNYNDMLAPRLMQAILRNPALQTGGGLFGDLGQPTDTRINEAILRKKERDQGRAYFKLQHMLDTALMDKDRYPLKPGLLRVMPVPAGNLPLQINWVAADQFRYDLPAGHPLPKERLFKVSGFGTEFSPDTGCCMYIDPAGGGQNGDELAYAVTRYVNGYVFIVDVAGRPGSVEEADIAWLADAVARWKPSVVRIEENYGNGALRKIATPALLKRHRCQIEGIRETGQKELRIISTLEPLLGSGRLVIDQDVIVQDYKSTQKYAVEKRSSYCMLFQMARLTRDKGALGHDDRLDALAGSCRYWTDRLAADQDKIIARERDKQWRDSMKDNFGIPLSVDIRIKLRDNSRQLRRKL